MKRIGIFFVALCLCVVQMARAGTINVNWLNEDGTTYSTSTCSSGGTLTIPSTPPTKYGYNFIGWRVPYTFLDYIESTGTQYIDTGYTSNSNGYSYIEAQFTPTQVGNSQVVFGSQNVSTFQPSLVLNGILYFLNGGNYSISVGNFVANTKYTVTISTNGNLTAVVNGTTYTGGTASVPLWSVPIYLFRHNSGTSQYSKVKMHYFRLYDNGTLVRDMMPARRDSDNAVGMYDAVTHTFFTNAGTGTFTAGPEL